MTDMGIATGVIFIVIGVYLLIAGLLLATYIMNAIAFYTLARRRQIPNPFLAWIPIANSWIIGSIVDDYEKRLGFNRKWRVLMLTLVIVIEALVILLSAVMMVMIFSMALVSDGKPSAEAIFGFVVTAYLFIIGIAVLASLQQMVLCLCIYKIYESTVPEKAVKYFLLSYLVPLAQSVCLLKCRNKGYENPPVFLQFMKNELPIQEETETATESDFEEPLQDKEEI